MRRRPSAVHVLCLVGAVLVLFAGGRSWITVLTPARLGDQGEVSRTGTELAPALSVLGLVGLAAAVAVLVGGRTLVGWVLLVTGAGVVACVLNAFGAVVSEELPGQVGWAVSDVSAWSFVTALGGVLLFAAGSQTVPATDPS